MKSLKLAGALLAGIAVTAAAYGAQATAPDEVHHAHFVRKHHRASLEHMAIANAMAAELSARTGRSAEEISALFKDGGPRKVAEELGLEREQMKDAMQAARSKVIAQATAAGLISAEQAEALARARAHGRPPVDDDGE
ncbi:MAG: hypothetical protein ACLGI7_01810 [Gammaproteobacteria bacterium]